MIGPERQNTLEYQGLLSEMRSLRLQLGADELADHLQIVAQISRGADQYGVNILSRSVPLSLCFLSRSVFLLLHLTLTLSTLSRSVPLSLCYITLTLLSSLTLIPSCSVFLLLHLTLTLSRAGSLCLTLSHSVVSNAVSVLLLIAFGRWTQ